MPRGKKTAVKRRTGSKRKFATPIKARKAAPKKKVQTRVSAKSVVVDKFETLEKEVKELRKGVEQLINIQQAAIMDNYRNYFLGTQKSVAEFKNLIEQTISAAGVTDAHLEGMVEEFKEAPQDSIVEAIPTPGVTVELNNNHTAVNTQSVESSIRNS